MAQSARSVYVALSGIFALLGMAALAVSFFIDDNAVDSQQTALQLQQDSIQAQVDALRAKNRGREKDLAELKERNRRNQMLIDLRNEEKSRNPQVPTEIAAPGPKQPALKTLEEFKNSYKDTMLVFPGDTSGFLIQVNGRYVQVGLSVRGAKAVHAQYGVQLLHIDAATGLVFLDGGAAALVHRKKAIDQLGSEFHSSRVGENVFAYSQSEGYPVVKWNLTEGNISSEPRSFGGLRLTQTTLPDEQGMRGSLVFNADGKRVGVFAGDSETLDRVSFIIPGDEVAAAIDRCATKMGGGISTASAPLPKRETGNPIYELDADMPMPHQRGYFAGPDKKIIAWNVARKSIAAYDLSSKEPAWESDQPNNKFDVCPHPQGTSAVIVRADQKGCVLDLKNGSVKCELCDAFLQLPVTYTPYGPDYLVSSYRGFCFSDPRSGRESAVAKICILGHHGNTYYYCNAEGILGKFDSEQMRRVLMKTAEIRKTFQKVTKDNEKVVLNTFNERYAELQDALVSFGVTISTPSAATEYQCCVIPGEEPRHDRIVVGRDVYEVLSDGLKRQKPLEAREHNGASQPWFANYKGQLDLSMPRITALSPDYKYGTTYTHIIDLNTMESVGELPFPAISAFFLSDSGHVCLFDKVKRKLVVFSLKQLLSKR